MVQPIPAGFTTLTAHLTVKGAAQAIAFCEEAFGAKLVHEMDMGGAIGHGWAIATHTGVVSTEECEARAKRAMPG